MVKGALFGFIAALMVCYYDMSAGCGASGVGVATKGNFVAAAVLILIAYLMLTKTSFLI